MSWGEMQLANYMPYISKVIIIVDQFVGWRIKFEMSNVYI